VTTARTTTALDAPIEHLLRELAPQVLGVVARRSGDFAMAEDAVQEALIAAHAQWRADAPPDNPMGWLYRVARRRLEDARRSEAARARRADSIAASGEGSSVTLLDPEIGEETLGDETLGLLFTCCHPSLAPASAIALTLRAVGGLTTAEVARAFFVPEATMAQRISRAKQLVRASGVPLTVPDAAERNGRLRSVLHVLYLMFSEGYSSETGTDLQRPDLAREAIRLTRALLVVAPEDEEVAGLRALMLLTDARRTARTGPHGELVPLDEQDRSRWDQGQILEGIALVSAALPRGRVGPYQLQAAIAAVHDEAPDAVNTDWPQILALYEVLRRMSDTPMVALGHAVASAMVHGPVHALRLIEALETDPRLATHHRLEAVRAHVLERLGERERAAASFRAAADLTPSIIERHYLLGRAARLVSR
jgi:RNA polymerase sigma factor (sigma-70 family)